MGPSTWHSPYEKSFGSMKDMSIWSFLLAIGYVVFKMVQVFGRAEEAHGAGPESTGHPHRPFELPKDVTPEQQPALLPIPVPIGRREVAKPVLRAPTVYGGRSQTVLAGGAYPGRKKLTAPTERGSYPGIKTLTGPTQDNSYPGRSLLTSPVDRAGYPGIKGYQQGLRYGPVKGLTGQQRLSSMLKKCNGAQKGLVLLEIFSPKYGSC